MAALHELLTTARDRHWCVRPYCTTCGARDYRRAIHANAVALVEALKTTRIGELEQEFGDIDIDYALRLLMMELANPFGPLLLKTMALEFELEGTEAGEYLAGMRRHEQGVARERAERAAFQTPAAAAERRRVKAERRLAAQADREEGKRKRDAEAEGASHTFADLPPQEALRRIIQGPVGFPLYRLPADSIEAMIDALGASTEEELRRLRERVPITRAAPLARLSRGIEAELRSRGVAGAERD